MQRREADAAYFMRRAREEAHLALGSTVPEAAVAHHGMSVRYMISAQKARREAEIRPAFPRLRA